MPRPGGLGGKSYRQDLENGQSGDPEDEKTYILRATCAPVEALINLFLDLSTSLFLIATNTKYQRDRIFIT